MINGDLSRGGGGLSGGGGLCYRINLSWGPCHFEGTPWGGGGVVSSAKRLHGAEAMTAKI